MRHIRLSLGLAALLSVALGACAVGGESGLTASAVGAEPGRDGGGAAAPTRLAQAPSGTPAPPAAKPAAKPAAAAPDGSFAAEAKQLDCKKLTGRMQVRILQMRADRGTKPTSEVSETLRQVGAPVNKLMYGGKGVASPSGGARASADRAQLEAYNAELKAKGCRVFDIEAELAKDANAPPPSPLPKAAAK